MSGYKIFFLSFKLAILLAASNAAGFAQTKFKTIPLPGAISNINVEFSGLAQWNGRVYLLPQYGSHKETRMDGEFNIYSLRADSINRVISGQDSTLTAYRKIKLNNLTKLPVAVKQIYQGFESITFVGNQVYMAIETVDTARYCFLLKGTIDTVSNVIDIDALHFAALKRPLYINNGGFEGVTYLPRTQKLIAMYEFNAAPNGGTGYLIDTSLTKAPEPFNTPFLYFRITDLYASKNDGLYAVNYFWDGEYRQYLDNGVVKNAEEDITRKVPALKDSLRKNGNYLKQKTFARIMYLKNYRTKHWKQMAVFEGFTNNWEGLTLFNKGALIVTDANRSTKQKTVFAYLEF